MTRMQLPTLAVILASLLICQNVNAQNEGRNAAESLLSIPDDAGWSLESMVKSGTTTGSTKKPRVVEKVDGYTTEDSKSDTIVLQRQVADLKAALKKERRHEVLLGGSLVHAPVVRPPLTNIKDSNLSGLREALGKQTVEVNGFVKKISDLKASLNVRDLKLKALSDSQNTLRHDIAEKNIALAAATKELNVLKAELAQKESELTNKAVAAKAQSFQDTNILHRVKVLNAELTKKEAALTQLQKTARSRDENLKTLQSGLDAKDRVISDLNAALEARNSELKQASTTLAMLREKQVLSDPLVISSDAFHRQSYMAGQMMARSLSKRIDGWNLSGVNTDMTMFRTGLIDGLQGKTRLKPNEARRAQEFFINAIQNGAVRAVAAAQKQLDMLSKGRKILYSHGGINWYRVRKGNPIVKGGPVSLALTEKVAGGKVISRIPTLIVRPDDDVPSIVKDGMYLPGDGGEVVGYGLARSIYGALPLPEGVQPFTVMEYHLTGSPARPVPTPVKHITEKR